MMILRFRLCGVELSYDNNTVTVGDRFKIVFEGMVTSCNILKDIITVTSDNKFTAKVMQIDDNNDTHYSMLFESEPEDDYGNKYSMDISNTSYLRVVYGGSMTCCEDDISNLTMKIYNAHIKENITFDKHSIANTQLYFEDCTVDGCIGANEYGNKYDITRLDISLSNCDINSIVYICSNGNKGNVHNSSIQLHKCDINNYLELGIAMNHNIGDITESKVVLDSCNITSDNILSIGIAMDSNKGKISNSGVIMRNCYIDTKNNNIYIGVAINDNRNKISHPSIIMVDCNIANKDGYIFIGVCNKHNRNDISNGYIEIDNCTMDYDNAVIGVGTENNTGDITKSDVTVTVYNTDCTDVCIGIDSGVNALSSQREVIKRYNVKTNDFIIN